jgi:hypothetical protein
LLFWFDDTNFPRARDTGGENLYTGPKDVFKASAGGRLGHQAADHPWSALRVVKAAEKTAPMADATEAKAVTLHLKRY